MKLIQKSKHTNSLSSLYSTTINLTILFIDYLLTN